MKVREVMTDNFYSLRSNYSIKYAAEYFLERRIDGAPVLDDNGNLLGLLSKSHILRAISEGCINKELSSLMTREVYTVNPEDDILQLEKITYGQLPVVENGKVIGMVFRSDVIWGFAKNVRELSHQMQAIISSIYNPIIAIDIKGVITLCNHAVEKVLGVKKEQVVGQHLKDYFPESKLDEVISTGKAEPVVKVIINNKTFTSNRTPIYLDGDIIGAVAVLQDISELEHISRELNSTQLVSQELNAIIESSFDGIFVTDDKGKVLKANQAYERITGIKVSDILGKTMDELVKTGIYDRSVTMEVIENRKPITIVQEVITGKIILVTGSPIYNDNDDIFRVVTNVRDITELNQLQRDLEAMQGLKIQYEKEIKNLRQQIKGQDDFIYRSEKMKVLMNLVMRLSGVDSTILIQGESGVGKELIAASIHRNSKRVSQPFIKVNCGAIAESLLESELFGYEGGAFTGARKEGKAGVFEVANKGTLFLDEVGEVSPALQVKLLRVLQERVIVRVGGVKPLNIDVRIIAATNRNLEEMVRQGTFRKELYYRLNVVPVTIPPLRERKEDIPALICYFLEKFNNKYDMNKRFDPDVTNLLHDYDWPGNVRELQNVIERLVVMSNNKVIIRDDVMAYLYPASNTSGKNFSEIKSLKIAVEELEEHLLSEAIKKYKTTRKVAEVLGINQSTVVRKAARYGIRINKEAFNGDPAGNSDDISHH